MMLSRSALLATPATPPPIAPDGLPPDKHPCCCDCWPICAAWGLGLVRIRLIMLSAGFWPCPFAPGICGLGYPGCPGRPCMGGTAMPPGTGWAGICAPTPGEALTYTDPLVSVGA